MRKVLRLDGKRPRRDAIDQKCCDSRTIGQVLKVLCVECRCKLFLEEFCVGRAYTHSDLGAHIAYDRVADIFLKLCDELVSNGERQFIFSSFGEDGRDGRCREILEFINVEVKDRQVTTGIDARECCLEEFGNEDETQERCIAVTQTA